MVKRSKSSDRWLQRQRKDHFVRLAYEGGQISRAHFKLQQIDQRYKLVKPRQSVLELGAAPGGWTTYLEDKLLGGLLIAVDPLPITCGDSTRVIEGYAGEIAVDERIEQLLEGQKLDLVLSDMAPNISGVRAIDQAKVMELAEICLETSQRWMKPRGRMAIKAFQGDGLDTWVRDLKNVFKKVQTTKPKASRPQSREVFIVASGFMVE
jgi:23S rRNA (uridine2552-2'-O)-methyltransferase